MAVLKAGGDRHPDQRLVAGGRDAPRARPHRARADHRRRDPRAKRLEGRRLHDPDRRRCRSSGRSTRRSRPCSRAATRPTCPTIAPEDDATILFTSGSTGLAKGAVSTHRAVTTGVYAYTIGLATLLGIKESDGEPPPNPPKTLVNVPLFHVTGEVPVLLNSFVIGRTMVLMPKWDRGRGAAADREGEDHLFRRRADDEPRADAASRPRQIRPLHR